MNCKEENDNLVILLCQLRIENETLKTRNDSLPLLLDPNLKSEKKMYDFELKKLHFLAKKDVHDLKFSASKADTKIVSSIVSQKLINLSIHKTECNDLEKPSSQELQNSINVTINVVLEVSLESPKANEDSQLNFLSFRKNKDSTELIEQKDYMIRLLQWYNENQKIYCEFLLKPVDGSDKRLPTRKYEMFCPIQMSNIIVNESFDDVEDSDEDEDEEEIESYRQVQQTKKIIKDVNMNRDLLKEASIDESEEEDLEHPEDAGLGVVAAFRQAERKGIWITDVEGEEDWI